MSEEEDPLGLKELALNYDYLIYKVNDYVKNLSDETFLAVQDKERSVNNYLQQQLKLDKEMQEIDQLLERCETIELEFMKLDQLSVFIQEFKCRLDKLEQQVT